MKGGFFVHPICEDYFYCKKCGRIIIRISKMTCDCCGSKMFPIPEEYNKWKNLDKIKADVREKYVKTSSEFNPRTFKYREERFAADCAAKRAAKAAGKTTSPSGPPKVECPYCHSTSTKKISTLSKAAHTYMFGIFSMSRNSKNFHCNKCGADF